MPVVTIQSHPSPLPLPRRRRRRRGARIPVALTFASLALAVALAGCGSSSSPGANLDPATVVPASAPLYIGAIVQPSGSLKSDTLAAAQKLTGSKEPFSGFLKVLTPNGAGEVDGHPIDYSRDVKPWLGSQAGAFVASIDASSTTQALLGSISEGISSGSVVGFGEGTVRALLSAKGTQGAVVLDTSNVSKARAFLEARGHETGAHTTAYRGVSYQVSADGTAEGIVGGFAVIGTETALHDVIETEQAGAASSIVHAAGYAKLAATAEKGALANLYLRTGGLASLGGLLAGTEQAYLSLLPSSNSLALDVRHDSRLPVGPADGCGPDPQRERGAGRRRPARGLVAGHRPGRRKRHVRAGRHAESAEEPRSVGGKGEGGDLQPGKRVRSAVLARREPKPRPAELDGLGGRLRQRQRSAQPAGGDGRHLQ